MVVRFPSMAIVFIPVIPYGGTVPGAGRPARTSSVTWADSADFVEDGDFDEVGHHEMSPPTTRSAPPSQRKATSGFTKM